MFIVATSAVAEGCPYYHHGHMNALNFHPPPLPNTTTIVADSAQMMDDYITVTLTPDGPICPFPRSGRSHRMQAQPGDYVIRESVSKYKTLVLSLRLGESAITTHANFFIT